MSMQPEIFFFFFGGGGGGGGASIINYASGLDMQVDREKTPWTKLLDCMCIEDPHTALR